MKDGLSVGTGQGQQPFMERKLAKSGAGAAQKEG